MDNKILKEKVERIVEFEKKLGVEIQSVSFIINDTTSMYCCFDIYSLPNKKLKENISVKIVFYNSESDIICSEDIIIWSFNFLGFLSAKIHCQFKGKSNIKTIAKIKVYPQKY